MKILQWLLDTKNTRTYQFKYRLFNKQETLEYDYETSFQKIHAFLSNI